MRKNVWVQVSRTKELIIYLLVKEHKQFSVFTYSSSGIFESKFDQNLVSRR